MHNKLLSINYRDLKPENILICPASLNLKVIDYGAATDWMEGAIYQDFFGTPEFMPPGIKFSAQVFMIISYF